MKGIRTFIAVKPGLAVLRQVSEAQRELRARCIAAGWDIRWIAPPGLHVVLRYLGEICPELASPIKDVLLPRVSAFSPFPVRAAGFRCLEAEPGKQTVHVDVHDVSGELARLRAELDVQLDEMGFVRFDPDVGAGLVVGRVKAPGAVPLEDLLAPARDLDFGEGLIRDLVMYRSDRGRPGEELGRLWRIGLRGCAHTGEAGAAHDDVLEVEEQVTPIPEDLEAECVVTIEPDVEDEE